MERLKVVVCGGGLVAQVAHVPNLCSAPNHFSVVGLYDPSFETRQFFNCRYGITVFDTFEHMLDNAEAEALIVASPDFSHGETVSAALDRGLHVFCEKPLCYSVAEIDTLIAKRDEVRRVLQVGYMKRFDPSYIALLDEIDGLGDRLSFIGVEVNDPDALPFVAHHTVFKPNDVLKEVKEKGMRIASEQATFAIGRPLDGINLNGFIGSYCSSMIHDLNLVNGILDHLGLHSRRARSGSFFSKGSGSSAVIDINNGQACCHLAHVSAPELADYNERVNIIFDNKRYELVFPSPYLAHHPTRLRCYSSRENNLTISEHRNGFQEAFKQELYGFWKAIRHGVKNTATAEVARQDMAMFAELTMLAITK